MFKYILILTLSLTSFLYANDSGLKKWDDIDLQETIYLNQEIDIENALHFKKNTIFTVRSIEVLDYVSVIVFTIQPSQCLDGNAQRELDIYDYTVNEVTQSLGIELKAQCMLDIYIETRELNYFSIFR